MKIGIKTIKRIKNVFGLAFHVSGDKKELNKRLLFFKRLYKNNDKDGESIYIIFGIMYSVFDPGKITWRYSTVVDVVTEKLTTPKQERFYATYNRTDLEVLHFLWFCLGVCILTLFILLGFSIFS